MSNMFNGCSSLINLTIPNFDIKKSTRIKCMFSKCKLIKQSTIQFQFKNININDAFEKDKKKYDDDFIFFEDFYDLNDEPPLNFLFH